MCKTWYAAMDGCAGVNLDIDVTDGFGPETITWTDANNDLYLYQLYVHDYSHWSGTGTGYGTSVAIAEGGVAGTGANIILYGETAEPIEMRVVDGDSGEL